MEKVQRHIKLAYDYGIIKSGFTLEDYIIEAVEKNGYETIGIWGVQGSGKSSRMLQMGYWVFRKIYEDEVEERTQDIFGQFCLPEVFTCDNWARTPACSATVRNSSTADANSSPSSRMWLE